MCSSPLDHSVITRTWLYSSTRRRVSKSAWPTSVVRSSTAAIGDGFLSISRYSFLTYSSGRLRQLRDDLHRHRGAVGGAQRHDDLHRGSGRLRCGATGTACRAASPIRATSRRGPVGGQAADGGAGRGSAASQRGKPATIAGGSRCSASEQLAHRLLICLLEHQLALHAHEQHRGIAAMDDVVLVPALNSGSTAGSGASLSAAPACSSPSMRASSCVEVTLARCR